MEYIIKGREPAAMFRFFEDIAAIPHSSGQEGRIADYLVDFAARRGFECHRDALHNVIIKKPGSASAGKENEPPVILQGHTDMVCEKNAGTLHDFENDGLSLFEKDGRLYAKETTLGADNGAAVALMLAILDDSELTHPPLECIFTVQEETGLAGAMRLDSELIKGRRMINLDSEEEGVATVSCAGGMRVRFLKDPQWSEPQPGGKGLMITVKGLTGGHSGIDISKERGNANKLMGRVLAYLCENMIPFRLADIHGGSKDNAIPRECECTIVLDRAGDYEHANEALKRIEADIKREYAATDPDFTIKVAEASPVRVMSEVVSEAMSSLLFLAPNGIRRRNIQSGDFVICSLNMGVVQTAQNGIKVTFSLRSSMESMQKHTRSELAFFAGRLGFAMQTDSVYPGWEYSEVSPLRDAFSSCYFKMFNKELKIEAIHAGLECGIFAQKLPGLDAIAVGPDIKDCHTPQESMDLASCERFYKLLSEVLKTI